MCPRRCVPVRRHLFDLFTDVSMYRIMCDIVTEMLSSLFEHSSFAVCINTSVCTQSKHIIIRCYYLAQLNFPSAHG